jgi:hypothetical protein
MLLTWLRILWVMVALCALSSPVLQAQQSAEAPITTLKTTVRRVVVDVVVTGRDGKPVAGLTKKDFAICSGEARTASQSE